MSLVPYLDDSAIKRQRTDIWFTHAEFMHVVGGDEEEHAHLLAGYFLTLGVQVRKGWGDPSSEIVV